jgi:Zn-dependent protease
VRDKGYLTLNPLRYTDPMASILLPLLFLFLGGIGLPGGAVYIETWRLRSRHWDCAVSLAGPLANIILLALLVIPFHLGVVNLFNPGVFWISYAFLCKLQVMAILFNVLPIPPLDGFGAIAPYLKRSTREWCYRQSTIFILALIVVLWRVEPAQRFFWSTVDGISEAAGIPLDLAWEARRMMEIFRINIPD